MKFLILCSALLIGGCATQHNNTLTYYQSDTMDIIRQAAEVAPDKVLGDYVLNIKATGEDKKGIIYLNTELDYRDPRCVTVALHPTALSELRSKYSTNLKDFFIGKKVLIHGFAKRVMIGLSQERVERRLSPDARPPYKHYYYQTHIYVVDARQIQILD